MNIFRKDFWNPAVAEGVRLRHYVATTSLGLVLALIVAFWGTLGAIFVGQKTINWVQTINAQRASEHIHGGLAINQKKVFVAPKIGGASLPPSGGIDFHYWMGTTNQNALLACAAEIVAKALAYEDGRSIGARITISPRQLYDLATDGNSGTDGFGVSTSVDQYNSIVATTGVVSTSVLNYGPNQTPNTITPWAVEPVPSYAQNGMPIASHLVYLWNGQAAGPAAVQAAKNAILNHHPVAIGSDWFKQSEKASWVSGKMGLPATGDAVEYGHGVDLVRYNDTIPMPDGSTGAFLASNSFGKLYGRDRYGNINRGRGGYVWLSYKYIERYAFFGVEEALGLAKTGGGKDHPPASNAPTHPAPFPVGSQIGGGAYSPYVHNVVLHDTGFDITNLINYWTNYYLTHGVPSFSGVGIVATALTESSLHQIADRCCIPGDTSYGTFQFTLGTACSYGICSDIRNQLDNPVVSVRLASEYYANTLSGHPAVPFPWQYVFYNAGGGVSDSFAFNPGGVAYSNFQNFLGNWNYAIAYYMGGAPAPPAPPKKPVVVFHLKRWCRWFSSHRRAGCPSPYWHGKLGLVPRFYAFTAGVDHRIGGVVGHEIWHYRRRFMVTPFQHALLYSWPRRRGYGVKVVLR